jgi:hypothetical protein
LPDLSSHKVKIGGGMRFPWMPIRRRTYGQNPHRQAHLPRTLPVVTAGRRL